MKIFAASLATLLATVALLTAPAQAQVSVGGGKEASPVQKQYEQEQKERAEIDQRYRATVKRNLQATEAANDPWATIRPTAPARNR